MKTMDRYFLAREGGTEEEVTREEWIRAERSAGFYPKLPHNHPAYWITPATGGFSSGNVSGRIRYE